MDTANAFGRSRHGLIVAGVVNVELVGCEEFFEDVGVIFEDVLNQAVGFSDEATF